MKDEKLIFEDKYQQADDAKEADDLMTEEEQERVSYYIKKYEDGKSKLQEKVEEWEEIHEAYKGERTDTVNYGEPNPVAVNIMISQIEGQVSSMMTNNITGTYKGIGYSDQKFARTAGIVGDFILKQNDAKGLVKLAGRRYVSFGNAMLTAYWDEDGMDSFGLPRIEALKPGTLIIDDKIDDISKDLQRADYLIHEVGSRSIMWARRKFGDEIADAIKLGNNDPDFNYRDTDNEESFTYLRVWTRNNEQENLQLLEISLCGILMSESETSSPFYTNVFNRYPFFIAGLYKDESDSYYFGDGKILLPIQKYINKLYDELLLAIKFSSQGRTYADPGSKLNPNEFAEADPSKLLFATNPSHTIKESRGMGINEAVIAILRQLFDKVQETTRFSSLMTGNDPGRHMTATQAGIQMQQGITGIDDKKSDLSKVLGDALNYSLGLCMQFWDGAKAFRVADNDDDFEWVDARQFKNIPEMVPSDSDYKDNFKKTNPSAKDLPEFMQLNIENEKGEKEGATKQIELDVNVNIGEGLPNNKIALYNMVLSLSQIQLIDEVTGQPRPLIGLQQFRKMVESYLGIKIEDNEDERQMFEQMQAQMQEQMQGGSPQPLNINPNIPGANISGRAIGGENVGG